MERVKTLIPITVHEALEKLVTGGLMRIEPVTLANGQTVDAYVTTEEGRRRWFGPRPPNYEPNDDDYTYRAEQKARRR
jgi:hypothetical protein